MNKVFQENKGINQDTGIYKIESYDQATKVKKKCLKWQIFLRLASSFWKESTKGSKFVTLTVAKMKLCAIGFFTNKF